MKITTETTVRAQLRAVLSEDGTLSLRCSASAVYDDATGATAGAFLTVPPAEAAAVKAAMAAALAAATAKAGPRVMDALSVGRTVARQKGEIAP